MGLTQQLVKERFPHSIQGYNLRSAYEFQLENVETVHYGTGYLSFLGPKIQELVPLEIKSYCSLEEFKKKTKSWILENCFCMLCKIYFHHMGFIQKYVLNISFQQSYIILLQIRSTIMEMIKMIIFPSIIPKVFWYYIIIIAIIDNNGNIERPLGGLKYCNLYYFYTIDRYYLFYFYSIL